MTMGKFCCVVGCGKRSERDKNVRFFSLPKVITHHGEKTRHISVQRRQKWLSNIRREAVWNGQIKNLTVCSLHFHQGKPAAAYNTTHPDWAPTIAMGHTSCSVSQSSKPSSLKRYQQTSKRALNSRHQEDQAGENKGKQSIGTQEVEAMVDNGSYSDQLTDPRLSLEGNSGVNNDIADGLEHDILHTESHGTQTECKGTHTIEVQTNLQSIDIELLQEKATQNSNNDPLTPENFTDDEKLKFYSGLPNMAVFMGILELISPGLTMRNSLTRFQQMLMTLIRLRLNLPVQDIGYRFGIHASTVSRVFQSCIDVMFSSMRFLIHWPDRDQLRRTIPMCFREKFSSCAVIIDCFEVFIDRPSDFLARTHTWSSYKHHNTATFFIGITPQGTVSFISKAWGGRTSDKSITEHSGILNMLVPGDLVLADRGFDIGESVGLYCASIKIPAFTKGKAQLSPIEVETTRSIANVRIHVERVIGSVRQKYKILGHGIAPIDYLRVDGKHCLLDKIAAVCCALVNCCPSVVALE